MSDSGIKQDRIAVTGATGFVARGLIQKLQQSAFYVPVGVARTPPINTKADKYHAVGDIGPHTEWQGALDGCSAVVHTAARVHVLDEKDVDPDAAFHAVNVAGTRRLAEQAARVGVRKFVFLSSAGVHGPLTFEHPFTEKSGYNPHTAYAVSKRDAEEALWRVAENTGMEVVIVRPPLVYGPGEVPGNFGKLVHIIRRGLPLPLASIVNRRSFISRDNLVDFLMTCLAHPAAANDTFLVSDDDDQSTPDVIRAIANGLGKRPRLWPVPAPVLTRGLAVVGRGAMANQLCGSFKLDITHARRRLAWNPPQTFSQAIQLAMRQ